MPTPSLRAQGLGFAFASSAPLFDDVTFHLTPGWTGLVGANGAGKTTLLRLLRGELAPTRGQLRLEPPGATVAWCAQEAERTAQLDAFAQARDGRARRLQGKLALQAAQLARWPTLSPGERKRWQLGAALWREAEVLLLDEPGNHLDAEGLWLLREALREHRGVGLLVSHDRALLDDVTGATLRLSEGHAQLWPAPFSAARALWTAQAQALRARQREAKRGLEREERKLDTRRRTLEASTRQRSVGARMRNPDDSDARTLGADFRAESAERAHAATLRRVGRKAAVLRESLEALQVRDEAGQALFLGGARSPKPTVVQLDGPLKLPDGAVLLPRVQVQLGREEHLWVQGPNGRGKSTLLRAMLAACAVPAERRLVLPQELSALDTQEDLTVLAALDAAARGRVLQWVHALGVEPEALLRTQAPSPGEARKLRLALGLGTDAWLAVLDEPTNHLDLPSIERLEAALGAFPGALVLVTHDAALGAAVSTRTMLL